MPRPRGAFNNARQDSSRQFSVLLVCILGVNVPYSLLLSEMAPLMSKATIMVGRWAAMC